MIGLDWYLQMRRDGLKPESVDFHVEDPDGPRALRMVGQWLAIERQDHPDLADLRVLVGLLVFVHGDSLERAVPWLKAVLRAGAHTVLLCVPRDWQRPTLEDYMLIRHNGEDILTEAEL